jgi:16S rRNA (uracil1498-N3)-methyltransferase
MSNIRLFYPESLSINLEGTLNKIQSHYLTKVMRINTGEVFSLFNKSGEWEAIINEISKNNLTFKVQKQLRQKENESEIWLAFSPIKSNYFNFMIQKATELGVTKLIPVLTERTIVRKINIERLSKIVIEASEQSNRLSVPEILETQSLENFLKNNSSINLIFGDLNTENKNIKTDNDHPICILIGPEGDYTVDERERILNFKGTQSIKLSNNILRSETAVISALSIVNFLKN